MWHTSIVLDVDSATVRSRAGEIEQVKNTELTPPLSYMVTDKWLKKSNQSAVSLCFLIYVWFDTNEMLWAHDYDDSCTNVVHSTLPWIAIFQGDMCKCDCPALLHHIYFSCHLYTLPCNLRWFYLLYHFYSSYWLTFSKIESAGCWQLSVI